jgi:hypothetical protein
MGGVTDRYRRLTVHDHPVATGIAPVGDASACTNPTNGRGMSLGLMHVQRLRDVIRTHLHDPLEFAHAWDAVTEAELVPWYRDNVEADRARLGEIEALRSGCELPPADSPSAVLRRALVAAVPRDPDAFRAVLASISCLTPLRDTFKNQRLVERILELAKTAEPPPPTGPNRQQLLQLLSNAGRRNPTPYNKRNPPIPTPTPYVGRAMPAGAPAAT